MSRRLRQASLHVTEGQSLVVPLIIEGLPEEIVALGRRWLRKREFHLTAVSARVIEAAGEGRAGLWELVTRVASGRSLGPVDAHDEFRRARHPERPSLETLIVMADCPGLEELHRDLGVALGVELRAPPPHVTLYSTDPASGIGITDEVELERRGPALSQVDQEEVRRAMHWTQSRGSGSP